MKFRRKNAPSVKHAWFHQPIFRPLLPPCPLAQPHDSHTAKSKQALTRPFRRSSIRNPSTIERQMVRFSSRIARSGPFPSSLYLINAIRTVRNSSERRFGWFGAPLYADGPRHHQRVIPSIAQRQISRFSSCIPRLEALPSSLKPTSERRASLVSAVR